MLTRSDSIVTFAAAFAAAQSMVENASKDAQNPAFKRDGKPLSYADLTSVWDACRKALQANGLGAIQSPGLVIDGKMHMQTMLLHTSGEYVCGELSIPLGKSDAQGYGSAVTYARRYALGAMMGVCPEDDDGNAASAPQQRQQQDQRPAQQADQPAAKTSPAMIAWTEKQTAWYDGCKSPQDADRLTQWSEDAEYKDLKGKVQKVDYGLWRRLHDAELAAGQRVADTPF